MTLCNPEPFLPDDDWRQRTTLLLGSRVVQQLEGSSVLVVGLGGVGGMAAEMICRAGVGRMTIADFDSVIPSNINRQTVALHSTVGRRKADVLAERLLDINPRLQLEVVRTMIDGENVDELLSRGYGCVADAIDTIAPKVYLLKACLERGIPVISSMGAGGKTDPTCVRIADIAHTEQCPLARTVRQRLRRMGIHRGVTTVFSTEPTRREAVIAAKERYKKSTAGTVSYLPALFGCFLAAEVIKRLTEATKVAEEVGV